MIIRIGGTRHAALGAARTDEDRWHQEATGNTGDSPANRDKERAKEKTGKKKEEREGPSMEGVCRAAAHKRASGKSP